jgi:hypothetical protein
LLDGLNGAADTSANGIIDIAELIHHAKTMVEQEADAQRVTTPSVLAGDPFPVATVR